MDRGFPPSDDIGCRHGSSMPSTGADLGARVCQWIAGVITLMPISGSGAAALITWGGGADMWSAVPFPQGLQ